MQGFDKIGIISDAHGNYYAFEYAINILKKAGANRFVFLGDAVGYIPSIKVIESLKRMGDKVVCVRGNHEDMLLHGNFDIERDKIYQLNKIKLLMNEGIIDFIGGWDVTYLINTLAGKLLFVHGSPCEPTFGYVYPDSDLSIFKVDADFVFMGNSHYPFIRQYKETTYINVGSCGLPRDDGSYGAVGLFNIGTGESKIIRYDISDCTAKILTEIPCVHSSVKTLFKRKKKELFGEVYGK